MDPSGFVVIVGFSPGVGRLGPMASVGGVTVGSVTSIASVAVVDPSGAVINVEPSSNVCVVDPSGFCTVVGPTPLDGNCGP